ncbi:HK97 gp10 family phage protein [Halobellus limi]|uniref:Bacteriophage HK97-gp10, putative tail-component n=1 Tax=Halobellus limi TaxID=699433 RepID=A0A1H5ZIM7_9EURY|nr:HK97 gp10 family phage protein [Halobellus limi]QCC48088.1 HK97 gp10 family phage protein [Halobellus limi]SEG35950.1 Bacteriophage HK97-gp10, putative tail-component [Halobellus limi]
MSNFDARVSFNNERVMRKVKKKINRGIRDSAAEIADEIVDTAQNRIRAKQAVYTSQLLNSFSYTIKTGSKKTTIRVVNTAPQAPYQERGVRGVERGVGEYQYTSRKPPIDELLPWVQAKLGGMTLDSSGARIIPAPADD